MNTVDGSITKVIERNEKIFHFYCKKTKIKNQKRDDTYV